MSLFMSNNLILLIICSIILISTIIFYKYNKYKNCSKLTNKDDNIESLGNNTMIGNKIIRS